MKKLIIASKTDAGHWRAGKKWEGPKVVEVVDTKGLEGKALEATQATVRKDDSRILDTDLKMLRADPRLIVMDPMIPDAEVKIETHISEEKAEAIKAREELQAKREAGEKQRAVEKRKLK